MHWYLVHTKPRQEKCALLNLEQQGYQCYLPIRPSEKFRQNSLTVTNEPLFPRYLFIRLGLGEYSKSWAPIRSTRGVSRLVTFGIAPAKVEERLINFLKAQESTGQPQRRRRFEHGEVVRLSGWAFGGIEGIYQMADGEHRSMILIELLSRLVSVRVTTASLQKVS